MKTLKIGTIVVTLTLTSSVFALNSMRPGLWELTNNIKSKSGDIEKALTALDAQLAKTGNAMNEEGTVRNGPNTVTRSCVSKEKAEKMEIPKISKECDQKVVTHTSDYVKLKFNCTGNVPATGEGDFKLKDPKNYETKATMKGMFNGKSEIITVSSVGKWLSDDCGKVRE